MGDEVDNLLERARRLEKQSFYELLWEVMECSQLLKKIEKRSRKRWFDSVLKELYLNQGGKCALCGEVLEFKEWDVDHLIQFTYGGGSERSNIQLAHPRCNRGKGLGVDPSGLLRYLEDRYANIQGNV